MEHHSQVRARDALLKFGKSQVSELLNRVDVLHAHLAVRVNVGQSCLVSKLMLAAACLLDSHQLHLH